MKQQQKFINIGEFKIPVSEMKGEIYYPLNYIFEKVIGKVRPKTKNDFELLKDKTIKLNIDFGNGGIQPTVCLNYNDFREYLVNRIIKINSYSKQQITIYNYILTYFNLPVLSNGIIVGKYEKQYIDKILEKSGNTKVNFKFCSTCHHEFPETEEFFGIMKRDGKFTSQCRYCSGGQGEDDMDHYWLSHLNKESYDEYKKYGQDILDKKENGNKEYVFEIYNKWLKGDEKHISKTINNRDNILLIIKELYNSGNITKYNLTSDLLMNEYKINIYSYGILCEDIYKMLFEDDPFKRPWLYPKFKSNKWTSDMVNEAFDNYLKCNNITIDEISNFDFSYDLLRNKVKLPVLVCNDILGFVMKYTNNKYGAYKFNIKSITYWKNKENRVQALKYLIEKDMKISIDKIPLYLTKNTLRKYSLTLYHILYKKTYYQTIWEWVEECYPGKFIKEDFVINRYRTEFDSNDEATIHDKLHSKFNNLIYNQRNSDLEVKIDGMIPDWLILTEKGCYLIEYFGLYVNRKGVKRIDDYIKRTDNKLLKYKELVDKGYYKFIDLYPEDLDNNFEGLNKKIKKII